LFVLICMSDRIPRTIVSSYKEHNSTIGLCVYSGTYKVKGVVQFPPPPSTVMDRVRDRVRDRDMGRVRVRVRLRGLAIAAPSYSGP